MVVLNEASNSALRVCRPMIIQNLTFEDISEHLLQTESISFDDKERILHEVTTRDKVARFLDLLARKPQEAFDAFVNILESEEFVTNYGHIATQLRQRVMDYTPKLRERRNSLTDIGNMINRGGVPQKSQHYVARPHLVEVVVGELGKLKEQPGWVLIHGMGGCGKSSLAAEVLRHEAVLSDYFKDVVWMPVGKLDNDPAKVLMRLNDLISRLDPSTKHKPTASTDESRTRIRNILYKNGEYNGCLIVLDDVWESDVAKEFDVAGKMLVTSRDAAVLDRVDGMVHKVEMKEQLTRDESLNLLASWNKTSTEKLFPEAETIYQKLHGNPFALSLLGNVLSGQPRQRWAIYLDRLNQGHFKAIRKSTKYPYNNIFDAITISIENLEESQQQLYKMFAVFDAIPSVSPEILSVLWDKSLGDTEDLLIEFADKSMVSREWCEPLGFHLYFVHGLQFDVIKEFYDEDQIKKLHSLLVDRFESMCPAREWHRMPTQRDTYIWWAIGHHLHKAGRHSHLAQLYTDLRFVQAKLFATGPTDVINDLLKYHASFEEIDGGEETRWDILSLLQAHKHLLVQDRRPITARQRHQSAEDCNGLDLQRIPSLIQLALHSAKSSRVFPLALRLAADRADPLVYWEWENPEMAIGTAVWTVALLDNRIVCSDISPGGRRILLCGYNGRIALLDSNNGQEVFSYQIDGDNEKEIVYCQFLHNGERFVTCGRDGVIKYFELPKFCMLPGMSAPNEVESPGPADGLAHCWTPTAADRTSQSLKELCSGLADNEATCCILTNPDQIKETGHSYLFVGNASGSIRRLNLMENMILNSMTISPRHLNWGRVCGLSISHDDKCLAVAFHGHKFKVAVYSLDDLDWLDEEYDHGDQVPAQTTNSCCMFLPWAIQVQQLPWKYSNSVVFRSLLIASFVKNEVHVWNLRTRNQVKLLKCPHSDILTVAFSSSGDYVAAGTASSEVRLWSYKSGNHLATLHGHRSWVMSVKFVTAEQITPIGVPPPVPHRIAQSSTAYGPYIVSASDDETVQLWDVQRYLKRQTLLESADLVGGRPVAMGDGMDLVTPSRQGSEEPENKLSLHAEFEAWVGEDGRLLIVGQSLHTMKLKFIVRCSGESRFHRVQPDGDLGNGDHEQQQLATAFAMDKGANRVFVGFENGNIQEFEVVWFPKPASGVQRIVSRRNLIGRQTRITTLLLTESSQLVSSDTSGIIQIWPLLGDNAQSPLSWSGHDGAIKACCCLATSLVTVGEDKRIKMWQLTLPTAIGDVTDVTDVPDAVVVGRPPLMWDESGHTGGILDCQLDRVGRRLLTCSADGTAKVWNIDTGDEIVTTSPCGTCVRVAKFSPADRALFVTGDDNYVVRIWRIMSTGFANMLYNSAEQESNQSWITDLVWAADGRSFATLTDDVLIWQLASPKPPPPHRQRRSVGSESQGASLLPPPHRVCLQGGAVGRLLKSDISLTRLVTVTRAGTLYILRAVDKSGSQPPTNQNGAGTRLAVERPPVSLQPGRGVGVTSSSTGAPRI